MVPLNSAYASLGKRLPSFGVSNPVIRAPEFGIIQILLPATPGLILIKLVFD